MMTASLVILSGCKEEPLSVESEAAAEKLISVPGRVENAYIVTWHAVHTRPGLRAVSEPPTGEMCFEYGRTRSTDS